MAKTVDKNLKTADISVIVPVYNRERLLPAMLNSMAKQTVRPGEVIIVDNNSTDSSPSILQAWQKDREAEGWNVKIIKESRKGAAQARNAGEKIATSTYLSFFDSDDAMHPDFIEKAMRDFEDNPSLDITVWNVTFLSPDGSRRCRRILPSRPLENHLVQGLLSTQAFAVKKEFLKKAGGWNPAIGGWDDWELGLRLLLANPNMKINRDSRVDVTVQEDSITGLDYLHGKGDWEKTISEMESVVKNETRQRESRTLKFINTLLSYRRAILGANYYAEGDREGGAAALREALANPDLSVSSSRIIRLAYLFTRTGRPGAGALFPPLLRLFN